jgi:magnesium-transporting ATPase (P-type)
VQDVALLSAPGINVDESALTGESLHAKTVVILRKGRLRPWRSAITWASREHLSPMDVEPLTYATGMNAELGRIAE